MAEAPRKTREKGPDPLIGRTINDRFRVISLVAQGGMGKVYRAEQAPLGRSVALKVLNPKYTGDKDPDFHKRFFLEASVSSKLSHPNTVTIFDYGCTEDDVYFIVMELLEGRTLHRALREHKYLPTERALHISRQICRSLREAHALGVVHRDLKPANIFLVHHGDEEDFVKVLDFGLVKDLEQPEDLTQTGLFMGSPKYMSPEQIRGEDTDGRSDVYSLGVMLYQMLTGRVPFESTNSVNILMAHVHDAPPPMSEMNPEVQVPRIVNAIVLKAMEKDPENRFASMDAFLMALKYASKEIGVTASLSGESVLSGEFSPPSLNYPIPTPTPLAHSGVGEIEDPTGPSLRVSTLRGEPLESGEALRVDRNSQPGVPDELLEITKTNPNVESAPPTRVSAPPSREVEPKRSLLPFAIVGLALLGAVGLGAFLASGDKEIARPTESTGVAEPNTTPTPAPETAPAAEVGAAGSTDAPRVTVSLMSQPPGAMVVVDGEQLGPTPTTVSWEGDRARSGREVSFAFQLEGFQDQTVTRSVEGEQLTVQANLAAVEPDEPTPRVTVMRSTRVRMTAPMTVMMTTMRRLNGYKAEPY